MSGVGAQLALGGATVPSGEIDRDPRCTSHRAVNVNHQHGARKVVLGRRQRLHGMLTPRGSKVRRRTTRKWTKLMPRRFANSTHVRIRLHDPLRGMPFAPKVCEPFKPPAQEERSTESRRAKSPSASASSLRFKTRSHSRSGDGEECRPTEPMASQ